MVAGEKTDLHPPHADTPPLPSSTGLSQVPSCHLPSDPSLSASASPWHASCPPPSKFPSLPPLRQGPSVPASGTPMRAPRRSEAWRPHWPLLPCPVTRACGLSTGKSLNRPPPTRQVPRSSSKKKDSSPLSPPETGGTGREKQDRTRSMNDLFSLSSTLGGARWWSWKIAFFQRRNLTAIFSHVKFPDRQFNGGSSESYIRSETPLEQCATQQVCGLVLLGGSTPREDPPGK